MFKTQDPHKGSHLVHLNNGFVSMYFTIQQFTFGLLDDLGNLMSHFGGMSSKTTLQVLKFSEINIITYTHGLLCNKHSFCH